MKRFFVLILLCFALISCTNSNDNSTSPENSATESIDNNSLAGNREALHGVDIKKPVHQWLAYQANKVWSLDREDGLIVFYPNKEDWNLNLQHADDEGYASGDSLLIGTAEEDMDSTKSERMGEFSLADYGLLPGDYFCMSRLVDKIPDYENCAPYYFHFWNPDNPYNGTWNDGIDMHVIDWSGIEIDYNFRSNIQRAEYIWENYVIPKYASNRHESYYYLGRVVHLLTDMCVPAHVHNDPHPGDDIFEIFMGLTGGYDDLEPNLYHFDGSLYKDAQYNYEEVYFPDGVKDDASNLFKLFWYVAQKTQYFACNDENGNSFYSEGDGTLREIPDNALWESGTEIIMLSSQVDGEGNEENHKKIAEVLSPHTMKAIAGLYRLFWHETHNIKPPVSPSSISVESSTASQTTLQWQDNSDNETGFRIYRANEAPGYPGGHTGMDLVGTVGQNVTSFQDTQISPGTWYCYQIYAFNELGESEIYHDYLFVYTPDTGGGDPEPDLIVSDISISNTTPEVLESFTVTATVKNIGDADSVSTVLSYYYSDDPSMASRAKLGFNDLDSLGPGETSTHSGSFDINVTGNYWVAAVARIDYGEANIYNNWSTPIPITILPKTINPNSLEIYYIASTNYIPTIGESFTIQTGIKLVDDSVVSNVNNTFMRYYISNDSIVTVDDTPLGYTPLGIVNQYNSPKSADEDFSIDISGEYWIAAIMEAPNGSTMVNASDMSSAIKITVIDPDQPILSVLPTMQNVSREAGATMFTINNTGGGSMPWIASVISGSDWLSIKSGSSGTDSGTVIINHSENELENSRMGTIHITANGATNNPIDVTISQKGIKVIGSCKNYLYIPDLKNDSVVVVDELTNIIIDRIDVGKTPIDIAVSPSNNRVYVTNHESNSVSVIDTFSNTVIDTIKVGNDPSSIVITSSEDRLYVANDHISESISVIDTASNSIIETITNEHMEYPGRLLLNESDTKLYVSDSWANSIFIIDTNTNTLVDTIQSNSDFKPIFMNINPSETKLYIVGEGTPLMVVDLSTNIATYIPDLGDRLIGLTMNPSGTSLYIASVDESLNYTILVVDPSTYAVMNTIPSNRQYTFTTNSLGTRLYTAGIDSGNINVFDTATNNYINTIYTEGSFIFFGKPIDIEVCTVSVPNIINLFQLEAESAIVFANLMVGTISESYSDTVPAGDVISQSPESDSLAAKNSTVDFVVSLGPEPINDECPDDPDKTEPGECGCGVPDTDSDSDGIPDCNDSCANDSDNNCSNNDSGNDTDTDNDTDNDPEPFDTHVLIPYESPHKLKFESFSGATIDYCEQIMNPSSEGDPDNVDFPWGIFRFKLENVESGKSTTIKITLPDNANPNTYYKYGPAPDNPTDHWYPFMYDGATGAEINGNIITLHFVDGKRGDSDLAANGIIVDPGAPGITTESETQTGDIEQAPAATGDDGGGGGCFIGSLTQ